AGNEPERHAGGRLDAVGPQGDPPDLALAVVRLEPQLAVAGLLHPTLRVVLDPALERQGVGTVGRDRRGAEPQPLPGRVLLGVLRPSRHVVAGALHPRQPPDLLAQPDRGVLLPARTAEVDGVAARRLVAGQELLPIEADLPLPGPVQRGVGDARAADELMELEGEEGLVAAAPGARPVTFRRRCDDEELLERPGARVLRTTCVACQGLRRLVQGHRPGPDPLVALVLARYAEPGLDPDGERMIAELVVGDPPRQTGVQRRAEARPNRFRGLARVRHPLQVLPHDVEGMDLRREEA